ncbi:BAR adaptor protein Hob1 [Dispira parvispora]|uniref:BAR adaptor protein Hob1 n=1 Tax=Dispira parvispora TaxID=1520584 RepID=A0A9W8AWT4_9FUNG|nr:BAR adaptor protein Hob1 [Dispira parvispora]
MSWKGLKKAVNRLPYQIKAKAGQAEATVDEDYDSVATSLKEAHVEAAQFNLAVQDFRNSVSSILNFQYGMLSSFRDFSAPLDYSDGDELPTSGVGNITPEQKQLLDTLADQAYRLREDMLPELDVVDKQVIYPITEYLALVHKIQRVMEKRDRKRVDYDRLRSHIRKIRDQSDRELDQDKKLHHMDNEFEEASRDFTFYNMSLKKDIPQLLSLQAKLTDHCLVHFYQLQKRVYSQLAQYQRTVAQNAHFTGEGLGRDIYRAHASRVNDMLAAVSVAGHYHVEASLDADPTAAGKPDATWNKPATPSLSDQPKPPTMAPPPVAPGTSTAPYTPPVAMGVGSPGDVKFPTATPYASTNVETPPTMAPPSIAPGTSAAPYTPPVAMGVGSSADVKFPTATPYASTDIETPPSYAQDHPPPPAYTPIPDVVQQPSATKTAGAPAYSEPVATNPAPVATTATEDTATADSGDLADIEAVPPGTLFALALYNFTAQDEGDLSFKADDKIEVLGRTGNTNDWWKGRSNGKVGMFPANYVRLV